MKGHKQGNKIYHKCSLFYKHNEENEYNEGAIIDKQKFSSVNNSYVYY